MPFDDMKNTSLPEIEAEYAKVEEACGHMKHYVSSIFAEKSERGNSFAEMMTFPKLEFVKQATFTKAVEKAGYGIYMKKYTALAQTIFDLERIALNFPLTVKLATLLMKMGMSASKLEYPVTDSLKILLDLLTCCQNDELFGSLLQVGSQVLARGMGQLIPDDKDRSGLLVKTPPIGLEDLLAWEGLLDERSQQFADPEKVTRERNEVIQDIHHLQRKVLQAAVALVNRLAADTTSGEAKKAAARVHPWIQQLALQFLNWKSPLENRWLYLATLADLSLLSLKPPSSGGHTSNQPQAVWTLLESKEGEAGSVTPWLQRDCIMPWVLQGMEIGMKICENVKSVHGAHYLHCLESILDFVCQASPAWHLGNKRWSAVVACCLSKQIDQFCIRSKRAGSRFKKLFATFVSLAHDISKTKYKGYVHGILTPESCQSSLLMYTELERKLLYKVTSCCTGSPPRDPKVADLLFWSVTIALQCFGLESIQERNAGGLQSVPIPKEMAKKLMSGTRNGFAAVFGSIFRSRPIFYIVSGRLSVPLDLEQQGITDMWQAWHLGLLETKLLEKAEVEQGLTFLDSQLEVLLACGNPHSSAKLQQMWRAYSHSLSWLVKGCIAFCEAASIKKSSMPAARISMAVTHLQVMSLMLEGCAGWSRNGSCAEADPPGADRILRQLHKTTSDFVLKRQKAGNDARSGEAQKMLLGKEGADDTNAIVLVGGGSCAPQPYPPVGEMQRRGLHSLVWG